MSEMIEPLFDELAVVHDTATGLLTAIRESHLALSDGAYGNIESLQRAWDVMSQQERQQCSLAVWKDIPIHQWCAATTSSALKLLIVNRPDFAAAWLQNTCYTPREYFCHAVNMEDLIKSSNLIDSVRACASQPP
jgi:hypothetical protein